MKKPTLIEKALQLKKTPIFSNLELDLLLPAADRLSSIIVDKNEIIFDVKEQAYSMYFIVSGSILISNEVGTPIATLTTNDFFGEESMFNDQTRHYRASTQERTQLLTLSKADLLTIILEYPRVALGFLEAYTKSIPCREAVKTAPK